MLQPGYLDLIAQRWQPFSATIDFPGYDFSGASVAAQVRAYRDAPAIILTMTSSVSVATSGNIVTSTVALSLSEAAINATAFTNPLGGDLSLVWDIHITSSIGKRRWIEGAFTIRAGSTQNA